MNRIAKAGGLRSASGLIERLISVAALSAMALAAPALAAAARAAPAETAIIAPAAITAAAENRSSAKFLDCHAHTAGLGAKGSGCFVSPALRKSYKFPIYLKAFGVTEDELLREGDGIVIDRIAAGLAGSRSVGGAVVLALDGAADAQGGLDTARTQIYLPNAFVAAEVRKHPSLSFGASVNPRRAYALEELARVKAEGAVLVKWIPSIMDIDPADSALIPFYRALKEAGLPLLTHTGAEHSFLEAKDSLCDPTRLELPLSLGVTVIAAHAGTPGKSHGQDNMERVLRLMARFPNLYADISSLTQINKLGSLKRLLARPEARGRLLYGSDFPLIATVLVSPYYQTGRAPFARLRSAAREGNVWDRDVDLKRALGVPEEVFRKTGELLLPRAVGP